MACAPTARPPVRGARRGADAAPGMRRRSQPSPDIRWPRTARGAVAWVCAATLLLAQWAGLAHRIEHPRDLEERVALAWSVLHEREHGVDHASDHGDGAPPHHDCVAYDAATLGIGPPLASALGDDAARVGENTRRAEPARAARAPALAYHSRAPPRA